ncbi:hypothetical protein PG997_000414 [Apiospora hydei]|uniref:Heterokaryon incompatibility domain-containing protein n=1 Tax=Apiospora hydei TaxID=1337664 RepID=A0ABR1XAP7_9PEZI
MNSTPKLLVTQGRKATYLALSYSWGLGVRHNVQLLKRTKETFQHEGIVESAMTLSHQETLQVARMLGYRYVWIDAFGIIQDDKDDWATQSRQIADVYGNADLTLIAGKSDDSRQGFIKNVPRPRVPHCPIQYRSPVTSTSEDSTCYIGLQLTKATGPVEKRAWCFQELNLSRRKVTFSVQQLSFKCRHSNIYEDGAYVAHVPGNWLRDLSIRPSADRKVEPMDVLKHWYELTMQYSLTDVFDPTDNFATLCGVAKRFQEALQGSRYLAGIWECDMVRGLLWKSRKLYLGPNSRQSLKRPKGVKRLEGQEIQRAPSWSWLALTGPIIQATGKHHDEVFSDEANLRCRTLHNDGRTWTPDTWDPDVVVYPFPQCRLNIVGCIREVSRSSVKTANYGRRPRWQYSLARINDHAFLLEAVNDVKRSKDDGLLGSIVAIGLFDIEEQRSSRALYAMCLTYEEGLMLERTGDGYYRRVGVFSVEDDGYFSGLSSDMLSVTLI